MKNILHEFVVDLFNQIFGFQNPRTGKIILTRNAYTKMRDYQLTEATLRDTFKYGEEVEKHDKVQVTRQYANYSVGLWYKVIYTPFHSNLKSEKKYLIITCWKGGEL